MWRRGDDERTCTGCRKNALGTVPGIVDIENDNAKYISDDGDYVSLTGKAPLPIEKYPNLDGNEYVWSFQASANVSRDNNPDRTGVRYYGDVSSLPVTAYRTIPMVMYYENYNNGWIIPHTDESLTITFFARDAGLRK